MSERNMPWIGIVGLVAVALVCLIGSGCASFCLTPMGPFSAMHANSLRARMDGQRRAGVEAPDVGAWDLLANVGIKVGEGFAYWKLYEAVDKLGDAGRTSNHNGDVYNASVGRDGNASVHIGDNKGGGETE